MKLTYDHPLELNSPKPVGIVGVKHGVTEVSLSDGRIVRLSIHVEGLKPTMGQVDIAYAVVSEVMVAPNGPIMDIHEGLQ